MTREEIENKINDLLDEVYEARIGMTKGEVPDLKEVPERLGMLTADVLALPDEDSILMKELLSELRNDLETLSWEMGEIARRLRLDEDDDEESKSASSSETSYE